MSQLIRVVRICLLLAFVFHYKFIAISLVILNCKRICWLTWCKLSKNFNFPYLASSVQDFWRRWHITLSLWFRDYLYIPIGGNKNKIIKNIFNLLITMTIAGLWHGAAWNFILWGFLYGLILSLRYFKNIFNFEFKDFII